MKKYTRKTLIALLLVVSMLCAICLGGCAAEEPEDVSSRVVVTMGDYTLTNSQLQVFYWMQLYEMLEYYEDYYGSYVEYFLGIDLSKSLQEQVYNSSTGQTWHEYILEITLDTWHRYQATYAEAKRTNYQLPAEYQQEFSGLYTELQDISMQEGFESVDAMIQSQYGKDVTFEDYRHYIEIRYTAESYFEHVVSQMQFTDSELEEFFLENEEELANYGVTKDSPNLVDFRNILVKPVSTEDDDGNTVITEEAWSTCLEKAQDIFDNWNGSEQSADTFAGLAKIKSEDDSSASNGGLYQYVSKNSWATVDVRHILIMPEGGTKDDDGNVVYSEEEWEACREKAQELLDEYLAGEQTEEAFGELANEHSEDQDGKVTNGGLYTDIVTGKMVRAFEDWIFDDSRTPGETGLIKTEYGYHVMYFVSRNGPVDAWLYEEGRKAGDSGMVKTDDGYQILYYVGDTVAWEYFCRTGLETETSQELMESYLESYPKTVRNEDIVFGEAPTLK